MCALWHVLSNFASFVEQEVKSETCIESIVINELIDVLEDPFDQKIIDDDAIPFLNATNVSCKSKLLPLSISNRWFEFIVPNVCGFAHGTFSLVNTMLACDEHPKPLRLLSHKSDLHAYETM